MAVHTADQIIATARDEFYKSTGQGAAAFDYGIAGGLDAAEGHLQGAIYLVANRDYNGPSDEMEARWSHLRGQISPELDAYRRRCRERKYTGWSRASRGPIRYA